MKPWKCHYCGKPISAFEEFCQFIGAVVCFAVGVLALSAAVIWLVTS